MRQIDKKLNNLCVYNLRFKLFHETHRIAKPTFLLQSSLINMLKKTFVCEFGIKKSLYTFN